MPQATKPPKLTKTLVEAAEPRAKAFTIWCGDLGGFGVCVLPTGRRSYFVDYRNAGRVRRRMTIGAHGKVTTEEARKLALKTLGGVVKGEDPAREKAERRAAMTVRELCDAYLVAAGKGLIMGKRGRAKKVSTLDTDRGRIVRHIVPLLGRKRVIELKQGDVQRFIEDVTTGKTATVEKTGLRGKAVVEGGAGTAARTAGLLGGILSYAKSLGIIETNPAQGAKRPADKRRQRRMTAADYRQLGDALRALQAEAIEHRAEHNDPGLAGAWLLALTGCRLGEIVNLRRSEVDAAGGCLRLEDSKEGASVRPVGAAALDVLAALPPHPSCPYVLKAVRSDGPFGGMPGAWKRIVDRAGLEGVTPHTLRHGFASVANDLGFTELTVSALLGHSAGTVTGRYVHHVDSVLVAAADRVAAAVLEHMGGR